MSVINKYIEEQRKSGFAIGQEVRLVNTAQYGDKGWYGIWPDKANDFMSKIGKIIDIDNCSSLGILVRFDSDVKNHVHGLTCWLPYFVLEKADKTSTYNVSVVYSMPTSNNSNYPSTCPNCGSPAYKGLFKIECSKNCGVQ